MREGRSQGSQGSRQFGAKCPRKRRHRRAPHMHARTQPSGYWHDGWIASHLVKTHGRQDRGTTQRRRLNGKALSRSTDQQIKSNQINKSINQSGNQQLGWTRRRYGPAPLSAVCVEAAAAAGTTPHTHMGVTRS
eukprot:GHVU01118940.1.p1 GENE.GHVU01118940.1~~GHVU01118940.1.p1  ORF type:complete len:134 (+),score=11.06 GHVU01118940.1:111-512(+)